MRLIDADALKENIDVYFADSYSLIDSVHERVDAMPTIEPERKKGEWIKMPYHVTECSECGFSLEDWIQGAFYNYCPNCGARMGT